MYLQQNSCIFCLFSPVCILPNRDKFGRQILFFKPSAVNPVGENLGKDVFTCIAILMEALTEIEEVQIDGLVYVFDVAGITLNHIQILPIENWIKVGKNAEKALTGRHKALYVVNVPAALTFVINVAMKSMNAKLRSRMKIYKSFEDLDLIDKEYLPREYGGSAGSMEELSSKLCEGA